MYAVVANGICAICKAQSQLEAIIAVYPYPKFRKVYSEEEGREWIRRHNRSRNDYKFENYGNTFGSGYVSVSYVIKEDSVEYVVDTTKCGFIRVQESDDTAIESTRSYMKIIVFDFKLCDLYIQHHILAIRRFLKIIGRYVDVDIHIPDISIYLALMKYTGTNYVIQSVQRDIEAREGGFSITICNGER